MQGNLSFYSLLTLLALSLFVSCRQANLTGDNDATDSVKIVTHESVKADYSFSGLLKSLKQYRNVYNLDDTLSSSGNFLQSENIIDASYLIKFKLVDTTFNSLSKVKPGKPGDYHARLIGKYQYKDFFLILTYSMRTYAGDGNPLLILSVFSDHGILLDQVKFDLHYVHDPELRPQSLFLISKDFSITTNQIEQEFKLVGDKYVLIQTRSDVKKFKISNEGHFYRI
jgi:hypothetical protein